MEHDGDGVENYSISPKADPLPVETKLLDFGTSNVPPLEEYILFTKLGEIRFLFIATYLLVALRGIWRMGEKWLY